MQYTKPGLNLARALNRFLCFLVNAFFDGEGTKLNNGNLFGLPYMGPFYLARNLYIVDVRKYPVVVVNVENLVFCAMLYVLLVELVNRHVLLLCIHVSNLKDVLVLYILNVFLINLSKSLLCKLCILVGMHSEQ